MYLVKSSQDNVFILIQLLTIVTYILELFKKSLKDGQNLMFDPSSRKLSIKSSLAHRVVESNFKVGANFEKNLGSKIGYAHRTHCPKARISLCKANLAHLFY